METCLRNILLCITFYIYCVCDGVDLSSEIYIFVGMDLQSVFTYSEIRFCSFWSWLAVFPVVHVVVILT